MTAEPTLPADAALELFYAVATSSQRLVFIWTLDGRMLWTNETFVRETGLSIADFGFDNQDNPFIHPEDRPRTLAELGAFLASGERRSPPIANRFIDAWGRTRAISSEVHRVTFRGEPALLLISTFVAPGAVSESDASYRAVVELADDLILRLDPGGHIVYSNRRFQNLVKLPIVEVAKRRLQDFAASDADRARADSALAALGRGEPRAAFEIALKVASGTDPVAFSVHLTPLPGHEGAAPASILAILRDVSELRAEQMKREAAQAALEEARRLEAMGRLAAGVAHDFNSVLLVVKGWASLLDSTTSEEDRRAAVTNLRAAADRAAALTRQLLSFARRDALPVAPVDVDEALRALLPSLVRLLPAEMTVTLETSSQGRVLLDDTQLTRILFNLATNARDAMAGHGPLTIRSTGVAEAPPSAQLRAPIHPGGYVEIAVSDAGSGIPPEVLNRLFEPFFTTKGAGRGTGLGLASVYGIVSQLGGYIAVESRAGQGTTVRVGLPVAGQYQAVAPSPAAPISGQGNILVVEDDGIIRHIMTTILQRAGFGVVAVPDGEQALAYLTGDHAPVDLLCTDGMLPGLPPHQLIDRVKAQSPATRVLVVSGLVADEPALTKLRAGALPYLAKPFDAEELVSKVNQVLGRA
jgi:two-component system cell cycle sensor histidine kinase/response regulator CckA